MCALIQDMFGYYAFAEKSATLERSDMYTWAVTGSVAPAAAAAGRGPTVDAHSRPRAAHQPQPAAEPGRRWRRGWRGHAGQLGTHLAGRRTRTVA